MKNLIIGLSLLSSISAYSATVKITSFNYVNISGAPNSPLAELCGKVEGAEKSPSFIKVIVDAGSRKPASYNTLADDKGNFCLAVLTYRGNADVSLMGETPTIKALIK